LCFLLKVEELFSSGEREREKRENKEGSQKSLTSSLSLFAGRTVASCAPRRMNSGENEIRNVPHRFEHNKKKKFS